MGKPMWDIGTTYVDLGTGRGRVYVPQVFKVLQETGC